MIRFHGTAFLASGIAFTNRLCGARKCIRTLARTPYRQLHHGIQPPCSFPAFTSYKPHSAQPRNISSCVTERETILVRSISDLEALTRLCSDDDVIAVDTEFTSFPMYKPNVEVIQVATPNVIGAVDCAAVREDCIRDFVSSLDGKELIMHDARMDLQILGEFGLRDAKIFDTQIAYMMINCGPRIGLGDLLKELLGVAVDKSQQTSDWRIRPLTDSQIRYALGDVLYMHDLRSKLKANMFEQQREEWFGEEMQVLARASSSVPDADLWKQVRGSRKLRDDQAGLRVLKTLAVWREAAARSACLSANLIARDDVLVQMAALRPTTEAELRTLRGLKPGMLRYHARTLLNSIHTAVHCSDLDAQGEPQTLPTGETTPPEFQDAQSRTDLPKEWFFDRVQTTQMNAVHSLLMAQVHAASLQLRMSVDVLAPYEAVLDIARSPPGGESTSNAILTCPWRRDVVGSDLLRLKDAVTVAERLHGVGVLPPLVEALK